MKPSRCMFLRAVLDVDLLASTPTPTAYLNSVKSAPSRHPQPVPRSSIFRRALALGVKSKIVSISVSLSGLGIRVSSVTSKGRLQNSLFFIRYAIGSCWARRFVRSNTLFQTSAYNVAFGNPLRSATDLPVTY